MANSSINAGVNSLSAVQITKRAFNAALVENATAQIYGRSSTYNRFNDIVAVVNDATTMQQIKDNAEWRTVVKTRSNGVTFSNGSTLDYAPNNHDNDVNYYRVGSVVIMVAAKKNDASDADINAFIYLIVAYLINTPEPTTPEKDTTMKEETNTHQGYTHAARCLGIYLMNEAEIYNRFTVPAIDRVAKAYKAGEMVCTDPEHFAKDVQDVNPALQAAARLVQKHDHMTPTASDIAAVKAAYVDYIIECARYEAAAR